LVIGEMINPNRVRVLDKRSEQPVSLRRMADLVDVMFAHPDGDELLETSVWRDNPQCAVLGIDEIDGSLHDALQYDADFEVFDDCLIGAYQRPEAPLYLQDIICTGDQVVERVIEFSTLGVREGQIA